MVAPRRLLQFRADRLDGTYEGNERERGMSGRDGDALEDSVCVLGARWPAALDLLTSRFSASDEPDPDDWYDRRWALISVLNHETLGFRDGHPEELRDGRQDRPRRPSAEVVGVCWCDRHWVTSAS